MKHVASLLLAVGLLAGVTLAVTAQEGAPAAAPVLNAQAYVKTLVKYMGSPDPRLRFSVREGLRVMGPMAVSAVNEAKAKETNKYVKAFMTRTVNVIKGARRAAAQRGRRGGFLGRRSREVDIDRIAMEANLTWEQMDKALPILKKAQRDVRDLFTEFREAGGSFRDREAMQDLREEMRSITEEAVPKLRTFLSAKQVEQLRRNLNPMGRMMGRMGMGGRRGQRRPGPERPERPER